MDVMMRNIRCFRITDVVISDIDVLYISNSIFSEIFNTNHTV